MNKVILFLLIVSCTHFYGQNLSYVDEKVFHYPQFNSINDLAVKIASDFSSDKEKVRATYTWIADNIRYDNLFSSKLSFPLCYTSIEDFEEQKKKRINKFADNTFYSRKGICIGYAALFNELCAKLHVKSEIISGTAKTKATNNLASLVVNHAWNKVTIDHKSYLIDTTWSVVRIPNANGYIKEINYDYFMMDPHLFIKDHYPNNYNDSLVPNKISGIEFLNSPIIYLKNSKGIRLIRPIKGVINRLNNTNMRFIFQSCKVVENVSYYLDNKRYKTSFNYADNILSFNLNIKNTTSNNLTIFVNDKAICKYWLK